MWEKLKKMQISFKKRGQVADTTTWIVATLIIVFVILIFVYSSSLLSKTKIVSYEKEDKEVDWIEAKTSIAIKINGDNSNQINIWINENA